MRLCHFILFFLFIAEGCEKINYYPDNNIPNGTTKFLAHRAGGNTTFRDNTLESIIAALPTTDGIEIDVQISKNQTIWLSHASVVEACNKSLDCFAKTKDDDIRAIRTCEGKDISYTELGEVFKFMRDSFSDKLISVDLKAWFACSIGSLDIEGTMRREAEIILNLAREHNQSQNVKIETETASVLNFIQSMNTKAEVYLTSFGDFERAMLLCLKEDYDGISFKYKSGEDLTKEKIDLLHRKGLKIMVWNVSNKDEIPYLVDIGVDYIQHDL